LHICTADDKQKTKTKEELKQEHKKKKKRTDIILAQKKLNLAHSILRLYTHSGGKKEKEKTKQRPWPNKQPERKPAQQKE
jgi:hypothetical protein